MQYAIVTALPRIALAHDPGSFRGSGIGIALPADDASHYRKIIRDRWYWAIGLGMLRSDGNASVIAANDLPSDAYRKDLLVQKLIIAMNFDHVFVSATKLPADLPIVGPEGQSTGHSANAARVAGRRRRGAARAVLAIVWGVGCATFPALAIEPANSPELPTAEVAPPWEPLRSEEQETEPSEDAPSDEMRLALSLTLALADPTNIDTRVKPTGQSIIGSPPSGDLQAPPVIDAKPAASADPHVRRLSALVRQILARAPELMQAEAESRQADSQLGEAKSNRWPSLGVSGNAGQETQRYSASARTLEFNKQQQLQARVSVPILDFENDATVRQRESKVLVADWALTDTRDRLISRAVDAYAEVLRATQLLELGRENLKTHRIYVGQMKEIARTDIGRASDLPMAAARVSLAESVLTSRLSRLESARVQWSALSGLAPPNFEKGTPSLPIPALPGTLETAIAHSLENSPQLRQAQASIDVAQKQVAIAKSSYLPRLNAETRMAAGNDYGGISGGQSSRYVGVGLEWRLAPSTQYADASAVEGVMAARHAHDTAVLKLRGEVTTQWYEALAAVASMKSFDEYVVSAQQVVSAYKDQFKIGRRSLLDVLNAENELFTARSNATTARIDAAVAGWRLLSLQGAARQELGL